MGTELVKSNAATVSDWFEGNRAKITRAIPNHVRADSLIRLVVGAINQSPELQAADPTSLISAIMQSAALGLQPNSPLQQAYLVPYKGLVQLQIGYRGLISLATHTSEIVGVHARIVYEGDDFHMAYGLEERLDHVPCMKGDKGEAIGAYAVYALANGAKQFEYMSRDEIEEVRKCAYGTDRSDSPWKKWPGEMQKKTVIKRLLKRAPMSPELAQAVDLDNRQETGKAQEIPDWIDIAAEEVPETAPSASEPQGDAVHGSETESRPAGDTPRETAVKRVHAIGRGLYGKNWDDDRHAGCLHVSRKRTTHIAELTDEEVVMLGDELGWRELEQKEGGAS